MNVNKPILFQLDFSSNGKVPWQGALQPTREHGCDLIAFSCAGPQAQQFPVVEVH